MSVRWKGHEIGFIFQIKLSLILNNIIKDTLRVFQKGDSWFEFWSLLGDKKHNSTVKLCREDDRWKEFSTQLTKVINDLRECIKTQNIPNQGVLSCVYVYANFIKARADLYFKFQRCMNCWILNYLTNVRHVKVHLKIHYLFSPFLNTCKLYDIIHTYTSIHLPFSIYHRLPTVF